MISMFQRFSLVIVLFIDMSQNRAPLQSRENIPNRTLDSSRPQKTDLDLGPDYPKGDD